MSQGSASGFLLDVVGALDKEGWSGDYIANMVRPLMSWMSRKGIETARRVKTPRASRRRWRTNRPPPPRS